MSVVKVSKLLLKQKKLINIMKIYSDSLSKINLLQNYMESDNLVVLNTSVTTTSRYRTIAIMHFSLNKKHGLSDEHSDFVVKISNNAKSY